MSGEEDEAGLAPVLETVSDADMAVTISLVEAEKQLQRQAEQQHPQDGGKQQRVVSKTPDKKSRASTSKSGGNWPATVMVGSSKMLWTDWIDSIRKDALTPSKKNQPPHMGLHHLEAIESVLLMWERDLQRREADASVPRASVSSKGSSAKGRKKSRDEREGSPMKKPRTADGAGWSGSEDDRPSSLQTTPVPVTHYSLQWAQQNRSKANVKSANVSASLNSITTLMQTVPRPLHPALSRVPVDSTSSSSTPSPAESDTASQAESMDGDAHAATAMAEGSTLRELALREGEIGVELPPPLPPQPEREKQRFVFCASDELSSSAASGEEDNNINRAAVPVPPVQHPAGMGPLVPDSNDAGSTAAGMERELHADDQMEAVWEEEGSTPAPVTSTVQDTHELRREEDVSSSAVAVGQRAEHMSPAADGMTPHTRALSVPDAACAADLSFVRDPVHVAGDVDGGHGVGMFVQSDPQTQVVSEQFEPSFTQGLRSEFKPEFETAFGAAAAQQLHAESGNDVEDARLGDSGLIHTLQRRHIGGDESEEEVIHTSYCLADSAQESYDTVVIREEEEEDVVDSWPRTQSRAVMVSADEYAELADMPEVAAMDGMDARAFVEHAGIEEMSAGEGEEDDDFMPSQSAYAAVYDEVNSSAEDDVRFDEFGYNDTMDATEVTVPIADSAVNQSKADEVYAAGSPHDLPLEVVPGPDGHMLLEAEGELLVKSESAEEESVTFHAADTEAHEEDMDAGHEIVAAFADSAFPEDGTFHAAVTEAHEEDMDAVHETVAASADSAMSEEYVAFHQAADAEARDEEMGTAHDTMTVRADSADQDFPASSSLTGPSDISNITRSVPAAPSTSYSPSPSYDPLSHELMNSSPESINAPAPSPSHDPLSHDLMTSSPESVNVTAHSHPVSTTAQHTHDTTGDMSDSLSLDEESLPTDPSEVPTHADSLVSGKHQRVFSVPTPRSGCFPVPEDFWELPLGQQGSQQGSQQGESQQGLPEAPPSALHTAPVNSHQSNAQDTSRDSQLWSLPSNTRGSIATAATTDAKANVVEEFRQEVEQAGGRLEQQSALDLTALTASRVQPDAAGRSRSIVAEDPVGDDRVPAQEVVPAGVMAQQPSVEQLSLEQVGAARANALLSAVTEEEEGAFSDGTQTTRLESREEVGAVEDRAVHVEAVQVVSHVAYSPIEAVAGEPVSATEKRTVAEEEPRITASQVSGELPYISAHSSPLSSLSLSQHQYLSEPWMQRVTVAQGDPSGADDAVIFSPLMSPQPISPNPNSANRNSAMTVETRPPTRVPSGDSISGSNPLTSPPSSGRRYPFAGRTVASLPSSVTGSENGWDDLHLGPGASMKLSLSDLTFVIDGEVAEKEQESRKNVLATIHSIHSLHTGTSEKGRLSSQDCTQAWKDLDSSSQHMSEAAVRAEDSTTSRGVNSMVLAAGLTTVDYAQALKDMGLGGQDGEEDDVSFGPAEAASAALLTSGDQSDVVDDKQTKLNILEDSLLPLEPNFLPMAPFGLYALKSGNSDLLTGGSGLYALPMSPMAGSSARSERLKSTGAESSDGSQRGRAARRSTWALEGNSPSSASSAMASHAKVDASSEAQHESWAAAFTMVEPEQAKPPPKFSSATRPPSQYRLRSASPSASSRNNPSSVPPRSVSAPRPANKLRLDASREREAKPGTPSRSKSPALTASNLSRIPTSSPLSGASPRKSWDGSVRTSAIPPPRSSQSSLRSSLTSPRSSTQQSPSHRRTSSAPQSPSVNKARKPAVPRPAWRPVVTALPPRSLQERKQEMAVAKAAADSAAREDAAARENAAKAGALRSSSANSATSSTKRKLMSVESAALQEAGRESENNQRLLMSSPGDLLVAGDDSQSDIGSGSIGQLMASSPEIVVQGGTGSYSVKERPAGSPGPSSVSSFITASSPRITASSPRISGSSPRVSAASPRASTTSLNMAAASPRVSVASPRVSAASPRVSAASPRVSAASPRVSAASPRVSAASPRVSAASPRVSAASPRISSSSPRLRQPSPRRSLSDIPSLPLKEPLHTGAGFRSTGSQRSAASNEESLFSQELETPIHDGRKTSRAANTPNRSSWNTPQKPPAGRNSSTPNPPSLIATLAAAAGRPQWDLKDQDEPTLARKLSDRTSSVSPNIRQSYPGANQSSVRKHKLWAVGDDADQDDWLMSPDEAAKPGPLHGVRPESPAGAPALEEEDEALQALMAAEKRMNLPEVATEALERQSSAGSGQYPAPLSARQERRATLFAEVSRSLPEFPSIMSASHATPSTPTLTSPLTARTISPVKTTMSPVAKLAATLPHHLTPPHHSPAPTIPPVKTSMSPVTKPTTTPPHHSPARVSRFSLSDPGFDLSPRWKLRLLPRFRDRGMKTTVEAPAALGGSSQRKEEGSRLAMRRVKSESDLNPDSPRLLHFNNMIQLQLSLSSLQRVKSGGLGGRRSATPSSAPSTPAYSSIAPTPASLTPAASTLRPRSNPVTALTQPAAAAPAVPKQLSSSAPTASATRAANPSVLQQPHLPAITAWSSKPSTAAAASQVLSPTGTLHSSVTSPLASTPPRVSTIQEDRILSAAELMKVDPRSPTPEQKPVLDSGSSADFEPLWGFGAGSNGGAQDGLLSGSETGSKPASGGLPPLNTTEWQGMPFNESLTLSKPTVRQGNYLVLNTEGTDVEDEMWSTGAGYPAVEVAAEPEKETTFFFRQAQEESLAMQMRRESEALKEKERARLAREELKPEVDVEPESESVLVERERVATLPPQPPSARRISVNETADAFAGMPDAALSSRLLRQRTSGSTAVEEDARREVDEVSAISGAPPPSTPSFTSPPRPLLASPPASEDISLPPAHSAPSVIHPAVPPVNTRPISSQPPSLSPPEPTQLTPAPLSSAHLNALQETITSQSNSGSNVQESILQWITDAAYAQDTSSMELAMQLAQMYFPEPPLETIQEESAEYRSSTRSSPTPTPTVRETTAMYTQPPMSDHSRNPYRDMRPSHDGPSVKLLPPVGARFVQPPPPQPVMPHPPPAAVTRSEVAAAIAAINGTPMSLPPAPVPHVLAPTTARGVATATSGPPHGPRRISLSGAMPVMPENSYAMPASRTQPSDYRVAGYYQSIPDATPSWDMDAPIATSKGTENAVMPTSPERTVSPSRPAGGKSEGGGSGFGSRLRSRRSGGRSSSKGGSMDAGGSAEKSGKCRVQ